MPPTDAPACPGCGTPMHSATVRGVSKVCGRCGGQLIGLSPFEHMLEPGIGAQLWVASQTGAPGVVCPFCSRAMRQPGPEANGPEGIALCHTCQEVWVPASAADWMAANGGTGSGSGPAVTAVQAQPSECGNCGAPFEPDEGGRCRYCRAQIAAPAPIVFQVDQSSASASSTGVGILGAIASMLTQPIE